jgi:hypothetical protein
MGNILEAVGRGCTISEPDELVLTLLESINVGINTGLELDLAYILCYNIVYIE